MSLKTRFFNYVRTLLFVNTSLEPALRKFVSGRPIDNWRAKLVPGHSLFPAPSLRRVSLGDRTIEWDLSELMEWSAYFEIEDPSLVRLLSQIEAGDTVIDVGANVGTFLAAIALICGPSGRAIGLEPSAGRLQKCENQLRFLASRAKVYPVGLSSRAKTASIHSPDPQNLGRTRLTDSSVKGEQAVFVIGDEFVDGLQLSKVDLIKIDVEGHELEVLRGLGRTLQKFKPRLFIEIDPTNLAAQGATPEDVFQLLTESNYSFHLPTGDVEHYDLIATPVTAFTARPL